MDSGEACSTLINFTHRWATSFTERLLDAYLRRSFDRQMYLELGGPVTLPEAADARRLRGSPLARPISS